MKKVLSLIITLIFVLALVFMVTTGALADTGGTTAEQPDLINSLIDNAANIINTLILAAFGVLGTWVSIKLNSTTKLKNVGAAWDEAVKAAKLTVGELKQTVTDNLKAMREDGKLTEEEIAGLNRKLIAKTKEKMSKPAYDMLVAAAVDVEALILGAGEAWIEEIKRTSLTGFIAEGIPAGIE